ncbi:glutamine synthetase family protein [Marivita sp.]|uniref:glutamine synthetase family protein n=1 Tax=Marivita sp. TaxID=2003365 RepID=UPI0025C48144|nr:glutamine synthetase family protein [Marivita sp.]
MSEPLVMACLSDVAGLVRGKGFALADLDKRCRSGIGWTPTNVQITCFDGIAPSPFGSEGDVILWPDADALFEADIPGAPTLRMVLGDVTDRTGAAWTCCLRSHLRAAIERLEAASGLEARIAFEHEFMLIGQGAGPAFSLSGFYGVQDFSQALIAALKNAGMEPDSLLREYGPSQFEVTLAPKPALRAADEAIALREITRAVASSFGYRASFAPILDADSVGNGVHVHLSLWDRQGQPRMFDPDGIAGLSQEAGAAAAGILRHMPDFAALSAPSAVSFIRLQPHRWSAAFANLAIQDREAGLRICPVNTTDPDRVAQQYHYEYRAADAAASPWLLLASLLHAAASGVEESLTCPSPSSGDLSLLSEDELAATGISPLPRTPEAALERLESSQVLSGWFPDGFIQIYIDHKRHEFAASQVQSPEEAMQSYASIY